MLVDLFKRVAISVALGSVAHSIGGVVVSALYLGDVLDVSMMFFDVVSIVVDIYVVLSLVNGVVRVCVAPVIHVVLVDSKYI